MNAIAAKYLRLTAKYPARKAEWIDKIIAYKASLVIGRPFGETAEEFSARNAETYADLNAALVTIESA